jgi:hypothetical protein
MNTTNFLGLLPDFVNGVHALHNELLGAALVICFVGLIVHVCMALTGRSASLLFPSLVRLALIPIIIVSLASWGDMLSSAVEGLISDIGGNGNGANIFEDYQAAIARKMGTAAAAANISQTNQGSGMPTTEGDTSGGYTAQALRGVELTHYAYPGDADGDSKSSQGIGAFSWDSAPGSLIPMYSAALTPAAAQQYEISAGQSFTVTTTSGQTYNLVYADTTPQTYQGQDLGPRVDIYDPNNVLGGGDNFEQSISSINAGAVVAGQSGLASMLPNPGGSIGDQVLWAITLGLSWIASAIMWLMWIAQQLLYLVEMAVAPVFVACLMVPALTHLARRFFMVLVGICLWPLGWAVCNLVSKALIDIAVNPTNNTALGIANTASFISGPLAGVAYLLVVAVWVIGSTLAAPLFIGHMLSTGGGTATAVVFGATLGSAANRGGQMASQVVGGPVGVANLVGSIGSKGGAYFSPRSSSRIGGMAQNYARRPMGTEE